MRRVGIGIAVLVVTLAGLRIALPFWLTDYVNRTLSQLEGYQGQVDDIDVHLYRGAYRIEGPVIRRTTPPTKAPLFEAQAIDLSLSWRALITGALVGDVRVHRPVMNFVDTPGEADQTGAGQPWQKVLRDLMPLQVNHFQLTGGEAHWRNFHSRPPVDIYLHRIELNAQNLRNTLGVGDDIVDGPRLGRGEVPALDLLDDDRGARPGGRGPEATGEGVGSGDPDLQRAVAFRRALADPAAADRLRRVGHEVYRHLVLGGGEVERLPALGEPVHLDRPRLLDGVCEGVEGHSSNTVILGALIRQVRSPRLYWKRISSESKRVSSRYSIRSTSEGV